MHILLLTIFALLGPDAMAETPRERNEKQAQAIWNALEAGTLPEVSEQTRYYTGPCTVLGEGHDPEGSFFALLGLKREGAGVLGTWWVTYGLLGGAKNPYLRSYEANSKLYPPNRVLEVVEGRKFYREFSKIPPLFVHIARDAENVNRLYVAGSHLGLVYCALDPLPAN